MRSRLSWMPKPVIWLRHRPKMKVPERTRIIELASQTPPADARLLVWSRDHGRCKNCGTSSDLQFDHVIPRSLGGSSRAENLEVLCGACNRRKGASVIAREARHG